jgi:hypothetical protein
MLIGQTVDDLAQYHDILHVQTRILTEDILIQIHGLSQYPGGCHGSFRVAANDDTGFQSGKSQQRPHQSGLGLAPW